MVASGDTGYEQAVKLAVRDACLAKAREVAAGCEDADEAYATLNANLAAFQTAATIAAQGMGFDGDVTVETGMFAFPDRVYGALLVPAGDYRALRVTLGEGGGHNWWCVLYPSCAWWTRRRIMPGKMYPRVLFQRGALPARSVWRLK